MRSLYDEGIPDGLSAMDARVIMVLPPRGYSNRRQVIRVNIEQMDNTQLPKVRRSKLSVIIRDIFWPSVLGVFAAFVVYKIITF